MEVRRSLMPTSASWSQRPTLRESRRSICFCCTWSATASTDGPRAWADDRRLCLRRGAGPPRAARYECRLTERSRLRRRLQRALDQVGLDRLDAGVWRDPERPDLERSDLEGE